MSKVFAFILMNCLFLAYASAEPIPENISKLAIAIVAPGPGASLMGHSFLLFMNQNEMLSESVAVQFNLQDRPNLKTDFKSAQQHFLGQDRPFLTQFTSGLEMSDQYLLRNRPIFIYFVSLDHDQIALLWQKLQDEQKRRLDNSEDRTKWDYDFKSRNCLTEALRFLNSVLHEDQQKIFFIDEENGFEKSAMKYFGSFGLYLRNAPFAAAPYLARHPLVYQRLVLPPLLVKEAKPIVDLAHQISELGQICGYQNQLESIAEHVIARPEIRESESFLALLKQVQAKCHKENVDAIYGKILQSLYLLSQSLESQMRIRSYMP